LQLAVLGEKLLAECFGEEVGQVLKGKKIVVGITGGIAAYKAAELVSLLVKEGASVHVIMTRAAQEFITPLTLQTLSGHEVYTGLFDTQTNGKHGARHIELADKAELLMVVPATANILGKVAGGIADDLLSTTIMAATAPVLFCPAMNVNMYNSPAVRENISRLKSMGYHFVEPGEGRLACGWHGRGRLAELDVIVSKAVDLLTPSDFQGVSVLVTAGPTREPLDPVRYFTNRSSGKMGYAVAKAALARGARVVLVSGPVHIEPPSGVEFISVETADEMRDAVIKYFDCADVVVKAAAVADYRPAAVSEHKIKKDNDSLMVELKKNPDILKELGRRKKGQLLVGFAAETRDLVKNAVEKIKEKNLDLIVANDVTQKYAGFESDTNIVKLIYPDGKIVPLPVMKKLEVAHRILDELSKMRRSDGH